MDKFQKDKNNLIVLDFDTPYISIQAKILP